MFVRVLSLTPFLSLYNTRYHQLATIHKGPLLKNHVFKVSALGLKMIFVKCTIVFLICVTQGHGSFLRRRRETIPQQSPTATPTGSASQQQEPSSKTAIGGNTGPSDPVGHARLVDLLLQAQQNINTGNEPQNQVPTQQIASWNREQIIYLRNLLKLMLQTRLTNMFSMTPRNANPFGRRHGGRVNAEGRDRTVFTPYGKVTYDGNDVSYDMEY